MTENLPHTSLVDLGRKPMKPLADESNAKVGAALFEAFSEGSEIESNWDELLTHRVCLLVGPAHSGKTSELKLLQRRLRAEARACFMLDLGTLVRATFDESLGADRLAFGDWTQGSAEGVFLLDALDEAELCDDKALLICIGKMASSLGLNGLRRSRFVVSSRPGSWSSINVLDTIRDGLCEQVAVLGDQSETDTVNASLFEAPDNSTPRGAMIFASLPPLTKAQASKLLRSVHGVENPAELQHKAWNLGLAFALRNPGSLGWLARALPLLQLGDGRLRAYEVAVSELVRTGFERRSRATQFSEDDIALEIERLCAASFFCQKFLFALRESPNDEGAVSLREALSHQPANFETLLQTFPFFIDSGIQRLKLLPSELQPFLAARWLSRRMLSRSMSVDDVVDLFVVTSFAGELIPSQFEVVAGWLSSMNPEFARRIVELAPHAVLLYGDLSNLPYRLAETALRKTVRAMSSGRALLYRTVRLTSDDYWQAMRPDLLPTALQSLVQFGHHDGCWDLLVRMAASRGCVEAVPALKRKLSDPHTAESSRVRAVDAMGDCGNAADVEWSVDALFSRGLFSARIATISMQSLLQRSRSAVHLQRVIRSGHVESVATSMYIEDLIEDESSKAEALTLVEAINKAAVGLSGAGAETAMELLVSSIKSLLNRGDIEESEFSRILDLLEVVRMNGEGRDFDRFDDIPPLIRNRPKLQEMAIRRLVQGLGKEQLWKLRSYHEELYARAAATDIETLRQLKMESKDTPLAMELQNLIVDLRPRQKRSVRSRSPASTTVINLQFAPDKARIEAKADVLANCADPETLARLVRVATEGKPHDPLVLEHWDVLAARYGHTVSNAVRTGLPRLWRDHLPVEDITNPHTVYLQTVVGLAAVTAEIQDDRTASALTSDEVTQAMHYSLFGLNQFPSFVQHLVNSRFEECDFFYSGVVDQWNTTLSAAEHARRTIARIPQKLVAGDTLCRAAIWSYLKGGGCTSHYEIEHALRALEKKSDDKALAAFLETKSGESWEVKRDDFANYISAWIRIQPGRALKFLAVCAQNQSRKSEIVALASYWSRAMESPLSNLDDKSEELAAHLEMLYEAIASAAPPTTDPYRTGVFTPNARDDAGQFRNSVLGMIEVLGGHAAFVALSRLAEKFETDPSTADMLKTLAVRVAERAALPSPWTTAQFVQFSRNAMEIPVDDEQSLWRRIRRDTRSAVHNVLTGRFHVGDLLKLGNEREMQLWLARELELMSQHAYSLHRESELADRTKPDVRAETPMHMVTLELKVADSRTVDSLLSDLELQLKGDYLSDKRSNYGIFVVMYQATRNHFRFQGRRLSFDAVQQILIQRAAELTMASSGLKHVEVVAFECPSGHSPRNVPN